MGLESTSKKVMAVIISYSIIRFSYKIYRCLNHFLLSSRLDTANSLVFISNDHHHAKVVSNTITQIDVV